VTLVRAAVATLLLGCTLAAAGQSAFKLPHEPAADRFGVVLIGRATGGTATKAVSFSHATHRVRYTCRVCHLELDFAFERNTTEITEEANRRGRYCGACHDGKAAFGHTNEHCDKCHAGDAKAESLARLSDLPPAAHGNRVDWSRALAMKKIAPVYSLAKEFETLSLDTTLTLEAEWSFVPPAIFPHAEHVRWLDCANCHPDIFNVKKKTTPHFSMKYALDGEFCGVCHLNVAFPLHDCQRCHPAMQNAPSQ
jgi:c(7)-type cytochrome triheme protein